MSPAREQSQDRRRCGEEHGNLRASAQTSERSTQAVTEENRYAHLMEFTASCLRVLRSAVIPPMPMKAS